VVGICYWTKKRAVDKKTTGATINTTADGFDTTQAPLVQNEQEEAKNSAPNDVENAINSHSSAQPQIQVYPQLEGNGYVLPVTTEDFKERAKP